MKRDEARDGSILKSDLFGSFRKLIALVINSWHYFRVSIHIDHTY